MPLWTPVTATGTICGPLGSLIFQRGRYGGVFRSRRHSARVPTAEGIRRMAAFAECSRIWSHRLTDDMRRAWIHSAINHPLQVPCRGYVYLSGQQLFIRVNVPRWLRGDPVLYWPP